MQKPGEVSVWVGRFDNEDEFFGYLEKDYSDDEPTSAFITQTDVEEFDEDFAEGCWFDPTNPAELDAVSYFSTFGELVRADLDGAVNAAYFIYDMHTEPGPDAARLKLLGVYPYQQV